ncbi:hypothetical protein KEU06_14070 [Pseudaminobacter sp. 19-2017]|uniref:Uncharacterized protein n=1 Tax=Pseudaminobacter soli (ex Zhang et al. 2022) TaxID=2831468 RepID=A0A942E2C2_9HYPH|nr:hypothetical protein [Pseudaminobacter soli]MBS3649735.1 hypothetical protein [Pseudaminobacter soli]
MTAFATYLVELERTARAASIAEEEFRRDAAVRAEELKTERAFAFRRLNLLRAIGRAVAACEDEDQAGELGCAAFLREVGWSGDTPPQREVAERFSPIVMAVWKAGRREEERGDAREPPGEAKSEEIRAALSSFEAWYLETRKVRFLHLIEREVIELPLVET